MLNLSQKPENRSQIVPLSSSGGSLTIFKSDRRRDWEKENEHYNSCCFLPYLCFEQKLLYSFFFTSQHPCPPTTIMFFLHQSYMETRWCLFPCARCCGDAQVGHSGCLSYWIRVSLSVIKGVLTPLSSISFSPPSPSCSVLLFVSVRSTEPGL